MSKPTPERTIHAPISKITTAPNYPEIMTELANIDYYKTPWVSVRIGVETGLLSYEALTRRQYKRQDFGWTYEPVRDIVVAVFKDLMMSKHGYAVRNLGGKKQDAPMRRFSYFLSVKKHIQVQFKFCTDGDVIARCDWEVPEVSEEFISAEAGTVLIVKRTNGDIQK